MIKRVRRFLALLTEYYLMDPLMDFTLSLQQSCVITVLNLILQQMNQNSLQC